MIQKKAKRCRPLCLLLGFICALSMTLTGLHASAAGTPTSLGLAAHGIAAYEDNWQYAYGGKGETRSDGLRQSDCAGLIYAYFADQGAIGGCRGGATSQVTYNCVYSGSVAAGLPNIHGLVITMPNYSDGTYRHIGIYIGGNEVVDNSDYGVNMLRGPVVGAIRDWTAWHLFDNGMKYPVNGWYQLDGKMVHYTNYEYDTDTMIDGYFINGQGYAELSDGNPAPVDESILSSQYVSASVVAGYLETIYSSGNSFVDPSENYNGRIIGDTVRLRKEASTQSAIIATLSMGTYLTVSGEVVGESVSANGKTSDRWYQVTTPSSLEGYVSALFAEKLARPTPKAPTVTVTDGYVTITTETVGADIYYTTDCTLPTEKSIPYTEPLYLTGRTFQAVAIKAGEKSKITCATVLADGTVFSDLTTQDWFYKTVEKAVSANIFHGNGDGTFAPNEKITRAQFVVALAGLAQADLSDPQTDFSDISSDAYYAKAVNWAICTGLVHGYPDNTFRPDEPITREQMCVILAKYAALSPSESSVAFTDDSALSDWAKTAVYACRDNGLIKGVGDNRFDPKGAATRAQACVLMVGLLEQ